MATTQIQFEIQIRRGDEIESWYQTRHGSFPSIVGDIVRLDYRWSAVNTRVYEREFDVDGEVTVRLTTLMEDPSDVDRKLCDGVRWLAWPTADWGSASDFLRKQGWSRTYGSGRPV